MEERLTIIIAGLSGSGVFDFIKSLTSKDAKDTNIEIDVSK